MTAVTRVEIRHAARAVILDPDDRILLVRWVNEDMGVDIWLTPGGGIDEGEDAAGRFAASYARRRASSPTTRGRRSGRAGTPSPGTRARSTRARPSCSCGCRPSSRGPTRPRSTPRECAMCAGGRLEELEASDATFAPRELAALLSELLEHGPPLGAARRGSVGSAHAVAPRRREARPRPGAHGRAGPRRARRPRARQRRLPDELLGDEGLRDGRLPARGRADPGHDRGLRGRRRAHGVDARRPASSRATTRATRGRPRARALDAAQAASPRGYGRIGLELSLGTQAADRMVGEPTTYTQRLLRRVRPDVGRRDAAAGPGPRDQDRAGARAHAARERARRRRRWSTSAAGCGRG